jgi:hypothetical protein
MRLHRLYFENFFVPFCRAFGYDEWVCDSSCLCNCLEFNLQRMEDLAAREKRAPQHGALKKLRAAVSETWKVVFGVRVTFHSDVEMMFKAARLHAPNTRAYSTTWDISIIFDYYAAVAVSGFLDVRRGDSPPGTALTNATMPLGRLRDKCIALSKVKVGCRSVDLTKVIARFPDTNRAARSEPAGLMGNVIAGTESESLPRVVIEAWRYLMPKNHASLADIFSPWVTLGAYADVDPADVHVCLRSALETYAARTWEFDRGGTDPALFLSLNRDGRDGKYYGLSSDRVANIMGSVMKAAGVPDKFNPHSSRHAFMADAVNRGETQDAFLASALCSGRVYELYYKCPVEARAQHMAMVPTVPNLPHGNREPAEISDQIRRLELRDG